LPNRISSIRAAMLLLAIVCVAAAAPHPLHAQATAHRVLAITPTPKGGPPLTPPAVMAALALAQKAGVNGDQLSNKWNDLETSPGVYNISDPQGGVSFIGDSLGWQLMYTLSVIDTIARQVPADLMNTAWDSPEMESRFHALIDALMPVLSDPHMAYVSVGNEVDIHFILEQDDPVAYGNFYADAVNYIHSKVPGLKVGVTSTFTGASGVAQQLVQDLNAPSDVFILTYYPTHDDNIANPPTAPLADFATMVQLAHGLPVILQEVGYPSAALCSSSPKQQAKFVNNVYAAWDQQASSIPFLSFSQMHDMGTNWCSYLEDYYGIHDPQFEAFICSIGLRYVNGRPKAGWGRFVAGARKLRRNGYQ
jgi:hypothetical protein